LGVEIKVHIYTYIFHFAEVLATLAFDVEAFEPDAANFDMAPTEAFAVTLPATLVIEGFGADPAAFEIEVSAGPVSASGAGVSTAAGASSEVALAPAFEAALTAGLETEVFGNAPEVLGLETLVTEGAAFAAALTPAFEVVLAAAFDEVVPLLRLPVVGDPPSAPSA
jgi:hypothetical protein